MHNGIRKYISNPAIGFLPYIIFVVLFVLGVAVNSAALVSIVLATVGEFSLRTYYKTRGFSPSFYISGVSLLITLFVWVLTNGYIEGKNFMPLVVCEVCVICFLMLLRASKVYIASTFFRKKTFFQKALMNEYYNSIVLIQYILTLHIFAIVLFSQLTISIENNLVLEIIGVAIFPVLVILLVGGCQLLKVSKLSSKLKKEEWLPIVLEKGEVTGKVAKSVSMNMKNRFLHPVVRVALVSNEKVYLQERPIDDILSPKKLDYPFEKYMLFNHQINLAARNSIRQMICEELFDVPMKFLLKYVFENTDTKRLIFLYVMNLDDENKIKKNGKINGKFWTIKQIEEGFKDELFSECFELEFEYLKNMVLSKTDIYKTDEI